jgi:hypothetical protein
MKPETSLCPKETVRWTYLIAGVVQGHPGHGKISASPCRTRSGISFGSGGSMISTVFPHWTRCQAISSQPLAVVRLCGFLTGRCFASDCAVAKKSLPQRRPKNPRMTRTMTTRPTMYMIRFNLVPGRAPPATLRVFLKTRNWLAWRGWCEDPSLCQGRKAGQQGTSTVAVDEGDANGGPLNALLRTSRAGRRLSEAQHGACGKTPTDVAHIFAC